MFRQGSNGGRGGSRGRFAHGGFFGGRGGSRRNNSRNSAQPAGDINRYINKAQPHAEETQTITHKFEDFGISQRLLANVVAKGYTAPMPIQDQAIGPIMEGKDFLGLANTGMGKTAAFLIPLINKVAKNRTGERVLIITPTRELAEQIEDEFKLLSAGMGLSSVLAIGGASINKQVWQLRKQWNFLCGTPGRLCDLVERGAVHLKDVNNLVLDEVDRMFDMGFTKDVSILLGAINPVRQSLFFSATLNGREEALVKANSKPNLVKVTVKMRDTATTVDQDVVKVAPDKLKIDVLHDILVSVGVTKTLVFARTKWGCEKLAIELKNRGFKADSIHGNKTQYQRQRVLAGFKQDRLTVLVATDVAARGLDIPDVSHVINYEIPDNYEDYIHRIGRTGRANKGGKALTFIGA